MWNLDRYKEETALVDNLGNIVSYNDILKFESELSYDVNERELVFCLCRNVIGSIIGYISFMDLMVVPLLLNANMQKTLLIDLIELYKPNYLWVPKDMENDFLSLGTILQVRFGYSLIKLDNSVKHEVADSLGLLLTTSGSTGSPKLVRQSYNNIISNAQSIIEYLNITKDEKPITTLPMNYTYGLSIINSHILVGATILVTDSSILKRDFWDFFKHNGATSFGGVPYTYEILDKIKFYDMNLPSLKYMTQAGGKITEALHEKLAIHAIKNRIKFIVMYGQCEATARMGYLPAEKALDKCGSMGIAIPGGRFILVDENNNVINEPFVTGELVYKGYNVTLGYAENISDLKKEDERKGTL